MRRIQELGEYVMTVKHGFAIVIGGTVGFGVGGALLGLLLGVFAPGYYRTMFRHTEGADFTPVELGVGLGLTQGVIVGAIIGAVVVLAVAISQAQRPR